MLLRINNEITAPTVGLWDDQRRWRGVIPVTDALALARAANLDLIEFAPNTDPPTCRIGIAREYSATGLADDLAEAGLETNRIVLDLIARYEDKAIRSGKYLFLLLPADAMRFAEEAATHGIGILGPNYWYGPGWEWYPAPDYSDLRSEPDSVELSLTRLRDDIEHNLPEGVAFIEMVLNDPTRPAREVVIHIQS